jgi:glycine/D-amino acid oxidase-like deaminating enzyme
MDTEVCVVGLGGSGLACIAELISMGRSVIGIDACDVASGASGRNGGFILAGAAAFYHNAVALLGRERARLIYQLTMAEIDRIIEETPEVVRRTGSLRIATSPEEERDCEIQLDAMRSDGLPVKPYEGPEGHGLFIPTDGSFDPVRRARILAERILKAGAQLFVRSRAVKLSGSEVLTTGGRIRCKRTIVAVDGNLEHVLPELAGRVRTARLQMIATAPALDAHVPLPCYGRWGYEYWQQLADARIVLGGFRDLGGDAEWSNVAEISEVVQRALESFLRRQLKVQAPITHRWAGLAAFSRTGLPIVEEVRPNLWVIGAYNGTGNVIGALCGRGVAHLAFHGDYELLAPFRSPPDGLPNHERHEKGSKELIH